MCLPGWEKQQKTKQKSHRGESFISPMTRWFPTVMMKQKTSWKTKALQLSQNRTESTERQRSSGSHPGKVTSLGLAAGSCPGPSLWGGGNRCTGWPVHLDGPGGVSLLQGCGWDNWSLVALSLLGCLTHPTRSARRMGSGELHV